MIQFYKNFFLFFNAKLQQWLVACSRPRLWRYHKSANFNNVDLFNAIDCCLAIKILVKHKLRCIS